MASVRSGATRRRASRATARSNPSTQATASFTRRRSRSANDQGRSATFAQARSTAELAAVAHSSSHAIHIAAVTDAPATNANNSRREFAPRAMERTSMARGARAASPPARPTSERGGRSRAPRSGPSPGITTGLDFIASLAGQHLRDVVGERSSWDSDPVSTVLVTWDAEDAVPRSRSSGRLAKAR